MYTFSKSEILKLANEKSIKKSKATGRLTTTNLKKSKKVSLN
jgi:hypothetical protein